MTENEIRRKIVVTAKKYLGCNEHDGTHKQFVDTYNNFNLLPRNHKMIYSAAWCATFVSAIAIECELTDIIPPECGCGYMISAYKKLGRWQEKDDYVPKIGDIIFYDWDDEADFATADDTGRSEHVGIVINVANRVITVIEGNKNDAVETRFVNVNGRYIRGYGVPDYKSKEKVEVKPAPKPTACPYAEPTKILKLGTKGVSVKWLQWCLNRAGEKLKVDGDFGVLTKAAVLRFQKKSKLVQDGIVGIKTRNALKRAVK